MHKLISDEKKEKALYPEINKVYFKMCMECINYS